MFKDKVNVDGVEICLADLMNAEGAVQNGERIQDWSVKELLPLSGKLIPEFDRRRNIRDMFSKKPQLSTQRSLNDEIASSDSKPSESQSQSTAATEATIDSPASEFDSFGSTAMLELPARNAPITGSP